MTDPKEIDATSTRADELPVELLDQVAGGELPVVDGMWIGGE
jgi:hypothetical protein